MLTTADLLTQVLSAIMGKKTVNPSDFFGPGCTDPEIPSSYFSSDRLRRHAGEPVNDMCAVRVCQVAEIVLGGRSRIDAPRASRKLSLLFWGLFGVDASRYVFAAGDTADERAGKAAALLTLLRCLMNVAVGRGEVSKAEVTAALAAEAGRMGHAAAGAQDADDGYGYGVVGFSFRVQDVGYSALIGACVERLDVVHFHGLTWTNMHREFLEDALARGVAVRVGLLSPDSPFFVPYAEHMGIKPERLADKVRDAGEAWRKMADCVAAAGGAPDLTVYHTMGFPAKAMHRFDDVMVVTPTTNAREKGQFMSYTCVGTGSPKSAWGICMGEVESVLAGAEVAWATAFSSAA